MNEISLQTNKNNEISDFLSFIKKSDLYQIYTATERLSTDSIEVKLKQSSIKAIELRFDSC